MKAVAVFPATREVKLTEHAEVPRPLADGVKFRVLEVGVCGTDREICAFEYGLPPRGSDHLVIGHEALGEVVEVGSAVGHVEVGDLVVPSVRRPCPHPECLACRSGHQDYCYTGDFDERGIVRSQGYMVEYALDEERYLHVVPRGLRDLAVLTEPLTIAEKALGQIFWLMQKRPPWIDPDERGARWGAGLSALVLGIGPVGLLGAMKLVSSGFSTYVYSRELGPTPRTDLVGAVGGTYVSSQESTFAELRDLIGNVDVVYEAVGHSQFALEALEVLGTNGIYVMTGVPAPQGFVETDPAKTMREMVLKNQLLLGTVNAGADAFVSAIDSIAEFSDRWPQVMHALIAGRYPPEQAPELVLNRHKGIKSVISFDRP